MASLRGSPASRPFGVLQQDCLRGEVQQEVVLGVALEGANEVAPLYRLPPVVLREGPRALRQCRNEELASCATAVRERFGFAAGTTAISGQGLLVAPYAAT